MSPSVESIDSLLLTARHHVCAARRTGNGVYGLAPLVDSASTLRFEIARSDVWQCGMDPWLPIGYLRLQLAGTMMSGFMNQSLVSGAVTGRVTTTAGALEFRAYSQPCHGSAQRPGVVCDRRRAYCIARAGERAGHRAGDVWRRHRQPSSCVRRRGHW
jgi:hypothetical protein